MRLRLSAGDQADSRPKAGATVLYLTRKIGEAIVINDNVRVTVVEIRGKSIKLGFTFPPSVSVLREELYERIQAENRAAAESSGDLLGPVMPGEPDTPERPDPKREG